MNDRINKLAGQAKFMAEEAINKKISKNAELDAFAEKFAELIILECASIDFYKLARIGTEDDYNITRVIKEHFGVDNES